MLTTPLEELLSKLQHEDVSILSENDVVLNSLGDIGVPKVLLDLEELGTGPTSRVIYIGSDQNPKLIAWVGFVLAHMVKTECSLIEPFDTETYVIDPLDHENGV